MLNAVKKSKNKLFIKCFLIQLIGTVAVYAFFCLSTFELIPDWNAFVDMLIFLVISAIGSVLAYSVYQEHVLAAETRDYLSSVILSVVFGAVNILACILHTGVHVSIGIFWVALSHFFNLNLIIFRLEQKYNAATGLPDTSDKEQFLKGRLIVELKLFAYIGAAVLTVAAITNIFYPISLAHCFHLEGML